MRNLFLVHLADRVPRGRLSQRVTSLLFVPLLALGCTSATPGRTPPAKESVVQTPADTQPKKQDLLAAAEMVLKGTAQAWQLTSDGYALLGGRPSLASNKPIPTDQLQAAKQKFVQSGELLYRAMPWADYPQKEFPQLYSFSDYVRASNYYGIGMVKYFERDVPGAETEIARSQIIAEESFKYLAQEMDRPEWADTARSCALLLGDIHSLSAIIALAHGKKDLAQAHKRRLQELKTWLKKNSL